MSDKTGNRKIISIIGGGISGSEAALAIASRGIHVVLYEMRPQKMTPAHRTGFLSELVCSNSLRSIELTRAPGVLKAELELFGSKLLSIARECSIGAGVSLAVDRKQFSERINREIESHPLIEVRREELITIPEDRPLVIATGPLTSIDFFNCLMDFLGSDDRLYFFDAVAPLVYKDSIEMSKVFEASRYGKGEGTYINCPMNKEQFEVFYQALINAEKHPLEIEQEEKYFEACLPVEEMGRRGKETLLYGPLKSVGLIDPRNGQQPYAVVQLRRDDACDSLYNMVGFQTNLRYSEQERVFRIITGLEQAKFARYGKMHLNTYINSPQLLNPDLSLKKDHEIFFSGQITGAEGYIEAMATGLLAGINASLRLNGKSTLVLPDTTIIGSLIRYITTSEHKNFQPMHGSFGLLPPLKKKYKKRERFLLYAERALEDLKAFLKNINDCYN